MTVRELLDGVSCLSLRSVALAVSKPAELRPYTSYCLKRYEELAGRGLPGRSPVVPNADETITLPAAHPGGGMSFSELVILARTTRTLKPMGVFEMGSYNGLTTAVFMLNSPPEARVYSLDLPSDSSEQQASLDSDRELVAGRQLGSVPRALGLDRYEQLFCDSMKFDATPYANSIDLGLVDAAHDAEHVRNDTIKMSTMMTDRGVVFWHDYGGKGVLRPLAAYLESIARNCEVFRIPETSLAWAFAKSLKQASL